MHPEASTSEPQADGATEPSLEESAGDHGGAGPGVRKEGAIASGSRGGEGPCASHMPIHAAGSNQHPSQMPVHTAMDQPASHMQAFALTINECCTFIDIINPAHMERKLFIPMNVYQVPPVAGNCLQ